MRAQKDTHTSNLNTLLGLFVEAFLSRMYHKSELKKVIRVHYSLSGSSSIGVVAALSGGASSVGLRSIRGASAINTVYLYLSRCVPSIALITLVLF